MQHNRMSLVIIDTHLVDRPNLFKAKMASKLADEAARVVRKDNGSEVRHFNGADLA